MESVVLVDENDHVLGEMEKLEAHRQGRLHRAFSVFIFNDKKELLIQQRALSKYHSGGLWTNTCCSHPSPGETIIDAAHKRLYEEMGFTCSLIVHGRFIYQCDFENGLKEHELDYILTGNYNDEPAINSSEVMNYKWASIVELKKSILSFPEQYTFWFRHIIKNSPSDFL